MNSMTPSANRSTPKPWSSCAMISGARYPWVPCTPMKGHLRRPSCGTSRESPKSPSCATFALPAGTRKTLRGFMSPWRMDSFTWRCASPCSSWEQRLRDCSSSRVPSPPSRAACRSPPAAKGVTTMTSQGVSAAYSRETRLGCDSLRWILTSSRMFCASTSSSNRAAFTTTFCFRFIAWPSSTRLLAPPPRPSCRTLSVPLRLKLPLTEKLGADSHVGQTRESSGQAVQQARQ
mmetsp:Transcript_57992/g.152752  ORF Transcript_57992/g.152752 Transcript_57992/m.152752 type:complete len:233 (+) Transcript_57992:371-1069(+)